MFEYFPCFIRDGDKGGDTIFRNTVMPPRALQKIRLAGGEMPPGHIPTALSQTFISFYIIGDCIYHPPLKKEFRKEFKKL